jgi:drug/metabolite transporter (DMT)-like permease
MQTGNFTSFDLAPLRAKAPAVFAAPILFVAFWSTGFCVARAAAPHADLSLFLVARFALGGIALAALARLSRARWPRGPEVAVHLAIGGLMHGIYLVAAYAAVGRGLSPGMMALIAALQPLIIAGIASLLGQSAPWRLWTGLACGAGGVALTVGPAVTDTGTGIEPETLFLAFGAVFALSVATILQGSMAVTTEIYCSNSLQQLGAAAVALCAACATDGWYWDGTPELWLMLVWAVIGITVGAASLLIHLIRRDGPATASALMLLTPPLSAIQGWLLFGETLNTLQIAGFVAALVGVQIARLHRT